MSNFAIYGNVSHYENAQMRATGNILASELTGFIVQTA